MSDLISRQAAIDKLDPLFESLAIDKIKALPSVQSTQPNTPNTLKSLDCIDRQAAIDVLHMDTSIIPYRKAREYVDITIEEIRNRLEKLPSVQPEDCDTCKHGYFGDEQCNDCRVRFTSHYERRTDD